jgi:hypothetical protein
LGPLASLTRVDACNPLLQAHPTWARDEHEGRGISTSLAPVSGRLAPFPPSRSPTRSTHLGWGTRHSLIGLRDPPGLETPTAGYTHNVASPPVHPPGKHLRSTTSSISTPHDTDYTQDSTHPYIAILTTILNIC